MTSHLLRLWVIGSYEMPRCDWLQHCNFLAGIEILPIALQTACKPCGFAAGRPAIVAGPVLRVAIGKSCSVCRALYTSGARFTGAGKRGLAGEASCGKFLRRETRIVLRSSRKWQLSWATRVFGSLEFWRLLSLLGEGVCV